MHDMPIDTTVESPHDEPPLPTWPADQLSLFEDLAQDIRRTLRPGWEPEPRP